MKQNYSAFLQRMIDKYEGGYGWDKADAGGPTKYGITCYRLAEHRGQTMTSMAEWAPIVQAMSRQEAEEIYARYYATPCMFNLLPTGVDVCVLDYGVNSGPGRAMSVARALVGAQNNDDLLNKLAGTDPKDFVRRMCLERLSFMQRIKGGTQWAVFGKGWKARVVDLESYCYAIIDKKKASPAINLSDVPTPKTEPIKSTPAKTISQGAGGSVAAGAGAKATGVPWVGVFVIVAAGIVAACMYAWMKHKQEKYETEIVLPA